MPIGKQVRISPSNVELCQKVSQNITGNAVAAIVNQAVFEFCAKTITQHKKANLEFSPQDFLPERE
ncbi:MAG: hypothetical protein LW809_03320 [Vampirovibrionales bacterium]|jgi:hypothetical protein|nr:hypothetical protein [Vampirovibrionales bacterium]